jgi:Ser/Thr protein kinase RdoA (MazF antagonist)
VLRISEMVAVACSLDDGHRCKIGDAAAERWGFGSAAFVRSSASHVFVAGESTGAGRVVLRLRPASPESRVVLSRSAEAAARLKMAGAAVAGSVPSVHGRLVEEVEGFVVTALEELQGTTLDSDEVDADTARHWGWTLADLHDRGRDIVLDEPAARAQADENPPRRHPADGFGLVHGDPEIDNVVWTDRGPAFVDFDDTRRGWYAADVAYALRDWAAVAAAPDLTHPLPRAFVEGYRERRELTEEEVDAMPAHARRSAAQTLERLQAVIAEPSDVHWPDWAKELHQCVSHRAAELRNALA